MVNAAMVAMAAHYGEKTQIIYHVTSAHQNPLQCYLLEESTYGYFFINPRVRDDMRTIQHKKLLLFNRYPYFHAYMVLAYKTPLQVHILTFCFRAFLDPNTAEKKKETVSPASLSHYLQWYRITSALLTESFVKL